MQRRFPTQQIRVVSLGRECLFLNSIDYHTGVEEVRRVLFESQLTVISAPGVLKTGYQLNVRWSRDGESFRRLLVSRLRKTAPGGHLMIETRFPPGRAARSVGNLISITLSAIAGLLV